jgi:Tn3 transposase DDE domain
VRKLNGESCLAREDAPPPEQQKVNSRSFRQRVNMQQADGVKCCRPGIQRDSAIIRSSNIYADSAWSQPGRGAYLTLRLGNRKYGKNGGRLCQPRSDQYSGFHGIVVPGTLRDSIFVLEGLLEQQTGLNPVEIMTDTAGASDIIFGLFWLPGYQFSPRLADAGEAVFWRVGKSADYGALDELARRYADLSKAEHQWDEMMRTAGSLKLGTIHASELILNNELNF